jgi:two-component system, OmpR family, sensor histidine kinase VicK
MQNKEVTETIVNPQETMSRAWEMVRSAKEEILVLFSSANAFARQDRAGAGELLKELHVKTKDLKIKILAPKNKRVEELRLDLRDHNIDVKYIQEFSQTKISIAIVDRNRSIVIELKNDNTMDPLEAIGLSTYSTRLLTVLSYVSIFESYWTLSSLFEESESELAYTKEYLNKVLNEMDRQKK